MNENGDNFTPPNFKDFSIIGGPNQSVSNSWINGKRSFSKKITYFLSPKSKGNITIGQAIVKINGEIYKTSPLKIEITEAVETSLGENNPNYIVENNIHLVAELSKENPYLNESFTVVYKLYYSDEIGISSVNELDKPKFPDFWSHTIKIPRLEVKQGVYKGSSYRYVTWNKTVLYPQKIGKLDLDPLTLNVSGVFQYKFFNKNCLISLSGANLHLLYPQNEKELVIDFIENELKSFCQDGEYINDMVGFGSKKK